jgi:hypothetical protein
MSEETSNNYDIMCEAEDQYKKHRYGLALEKYQQLYNAGEKKFALMIANCYYYMKFYVLAKDFYEQGETYASSTKDLSPFYFKLIDCYSKLNDSKALDKFIIKLERMSNDSNNPYVNNHKLLKKFAEGIKEFKFNKDFEKALEAFKNCSALGRPYIQMIEKQKQENNKKENYLQNELNEEKNETKYCELIDLYLADKQINEAERVLSELKNLPNELKTDNFSCKCMFYTAKIQWKKSISLQDSSVKNDKIIKTLYEFIEGINQDSKQIDEIKYQFAEGVEILFQLLTKKFKKTKKDEVFDDLLKVLKTKKFKILFQESHTLIKGKINYLKQMPEKALKHFRKYTTFTKKSSFEIEEMKKEMQMRGANFASITHTESDPNPDPNSDEEEEEEYDDVKVNE